MILHFNSCLRDPVHTELQPVLRIIEFHKCNCSQARYDNEGQGKKFYSVCRDTNVSQ